VEAKQAEREAQMAAQAMPEGAPPPPAGPGMEAAPSGEAPPMGGPEGAPDIAALLGGVA